MPPFLSGLSYMQQSSSEFPPETLCFANRNRLLRGGVNLCVNLDRTLRMLSPAKLSKSSGGAPGPGAPGYGRTWVHPIAFSTCGLKFFFRFFAQVPPATQRRAVSCSAVLCRALLYFLFRTYQTTTLATLSSTVGDSQHVVEHFIEQSSFCISYLGYTATAAVQQ